MRGPFEAGPSKAKKKSNARNCHSQAGSSTLAPSTPTHVNQDPLTQEHVPVNQEPVIQENVPMNQEHVNEDPVNQEHVNEVPMNLVPVNQVPVNRGVRVSKSLGVRARKPSERINKIQIRKQFIKKVIMGIICQLSIGKSYSLFVSINVLCLLVVEIADKFNYHRPCLLAVEIAAKYNVNYNQMCAM
ncbi:unnamed protein product [Lactuca virosa]|uniref:Uncharacterized protein n=1 Tax=Lactuca virosa TaxID=75947 RepID=A0AAU9P914_9ASTR|nr:unnamed protein product [Lactuca virosa]